LGATRRSGTQPQSRWSITTSWRPAWQTCTFKRIAPLQQCRTISFATKVPASQVQQRACLVGDLDELSGQGTGRALLGRPPRDANSFGSRLRALGARLKKAPDACDFAGQGVIFRWDGQRPCAIGI